MVFTLQSGIRVTAWDKFAGDIFAPSEGVSVLEIYLKEVLIQEKCQTGLLAKIHSLQVLTFSLNTGMERRGLSNCLRSSS